MTVNNIDHTLKEKPKRNLIHIEFLRIICIFLVLFNHTGDNGFFLFSVSQQSPLYCFYMFLSIGCKIAAPIFYMISGALLLGKNESLKSLYLKRILKWVIVLILSSAVYRIYDWYYYGADAGITQFLLDVYQAYISRAQWYLYSYIALLVMLPFLRRLAQAMTKKDYLYLAVCQFVINGVIPIVQFYFSQGTVFLNGYFYTPLFTDCIFYFLMGYYFEKVLDEKYYTRKNFMILSAGSFLCIVISCLMTQYSADLTGVMTEATSQLFHGSLIALPAMTTYYGAKLFFMKVNVGDRLKRIIQFAGSTTMEIFLVERILMERLQFVFDDLQPILHIFPACIVYLLVCMLVGIIFFGTINSIIKRVKMRYKSR